MVTTITTATRSREKTCSTESSALLWTISWWSFWFWRWWSAGESWWPPFDWDLSELRSIQDWTVRYALQSAEGVAEVASIGGHVKEYQVDVDPDLLRHYGVTLAQVVEAVKMSNLDVGARTIEVNKTEQVIRAVGFIKSIKDLENAVVTVLTTLVSFLPVFTLVAAEGKLFRPLAFTKTFALVAALLVALFLIPPLGHILLGARVRGKRLRWVLNGLLILAGLVLGIGWQWWWPAGEIPYLDYNRAQAELARLSYDEAALQDLLVAQWRGLNALLDRDDAPLPRVAPLAAIRIKTPLEQLPQMALQNRPEITAAHYLELGADASIELAQKGFWPNFGVGISWLVHEAEGAAPDRGKDALGVTVGFDLPIWRASVGAKVDEAKARRRQAGFAVTSEAANVRGVLADRIYDYVNARRLLTLYDGNLLPQAAAAMDSAEAQSQGTGNFGSLLERRAIWLQFSLARERALANLYKAAARLEQAVGTPLDYTTVATPTNAPSTARLPREVPRGKGGDVSDAPPTPVARGEQDPGHIAHDEQWAAAKALARKHGLKKALSRGLTRSLLDRAVLRRNPDVHRADEAVRETLQRFPQVAYLDNLVSQYSNLSAELVPSQGGMAPRPSNSERTTGAGTLSMKSAVAATEVRQAQVAAGLARRRAVTEARLALAEYRYATQARKVVGELAALTRQLRDVAEQRVAAGAGRLTHVLQAEMLEAELVTQQANLDDMAGRAKARMATLLDLPAEFDFSHPQGDVQFTLPSQKSLVRRDDRRQELRLKELEIERLGRVIALVQARSYPDLHTGQSDLTRPLAKDGRMAFPTKPMVREDIYSAGRQAYLDELATRLETLREDRRRLTQEIRNQITQARLELQTALRNRKLHGGALARKARQAMDLTLAAYRQGEASFTDLIVAERDVIRHRLGALEAQREAEKATTRLQDAAVWK